MKTSTFQLADLSIAQPGEINSPEELTENLTEEELVFLDKEFQEWISERQREASNDLLRLGDC